MRVSVTKVFEGEVRGGEADVWLRVQPHCKRVPRSDKNPLPDVKLAVLDNQCVFNVFLADVLRLLLLAQIEDLHEISVKHNAAPSGAASWFADPDITFSIDAELGVFFLEDLE